MHRTAGPLIPEIKKVFKSEVEALGGKVTEDSSDGNTLYIRSVLPRTYSVFPGDNLKEGAALKGTSTSIEIHPYLFRMVCSNGHIQTKEIAFEAVDARGFETSKELLLELRHAIRSCCSADVFAAAVEKMRSMSLVPVRHSLGTLLELAMSRLGVTRSMIDEITNRFARSPGRSLYGLANAVTSVARDTDDPEARWELEKYAGELASASQIVIGAYRFAEEEEYLMKLDTVDDIVEILNGHTAVASMP
jgi:hypothetical protein